MNKIIDIKKKKENSHGSASNYSIGSEATVRKNTEVDNENCEYGNISVRGRNYFKIGSSGYESISNFIIHNARIVECGENSFCEITIITEKNEEISKVIKISDLLSVSAFKHAICKDDIRLVFKGSNKDLEDIKGLINQNGFVTKKGIEYSGIVKQENGYHFVSSRGCLNKKGKRSEEIVLVGDKSVNTGILNSKSITKTELMNISSKLFNFNELGITASILGFSASCFFREMLYQEYSIKSPHLMLCGEAGSGKSETAENIIKPIFSITKSTSVDQCTRFVGISSASGSNMLPFIIEEYKPGKLTKSRKDDISALLRNTYDRTSSFRGNVEQKLNTYPLITPIVLVGEMAVDESAILERSILVYFSKHKIKSSEKKDSFIYLKKCKKTLNKFGRSLLEQALNTDMRVLKSRYNSLSKKYQSSLNNRTLNSAVFTMLGICLIADLFKAKGLDFEKCVGHKLITIHDAIAEGVFENIMEGSKQVKGIIEKSIEVMNDMAETEDLLRGVDYQVVNNGCELALNVKMFYPKLMKYIKNHNLTDMEILSQKQFTTQIKLKEYYQDYKAVRFTHKIQSSCAKAFVVNIENLKQIINIDNLCM